MKWLYGVAIILVILGGIILGLFGFSSLKIAAVILGTAVIISFSPSAGNGVAAKYKEGVELSERTVLLIIIGVMFLTGIIMLAFHSHTSIFVEPYHLSINLTSTSAIVSEILVYHVPPDVRGHEFYRSYYKIGPMKGMKVISIHCPPGFQPKVYEYSSKVELACRNPDYVKPGMYSVEFDYEIPKPYVCYTNQCLFDWNVMTNFGLDIINGTISVTGAKEVWGFPPIGRAFDLSPEGLLEVKAVKPKQEVVNYWSNKNLPDIDLYSDRMSFEFYGFIYTHAVEIEMFMFIVASIGLVIIYLVFGREPKVEGIPEVLHYPPTKRKPWDVNRIAYGDPNQIEFEGIQATLLDLSRRGWLEIKKGVIKFKTGNDELDEYEKKVYDTYKWLGSFTGGDLNMKELKKRIETNFNPLNKMWVRDIVTRFSKLTRYGKDKVFDKTARILGVIWISIVILITWQITPYMPEYVKVSMLSGLFAEMLAILVLDIYTFGRFKKDVYKEVLMWRAFGRLLGDYSLIKKYAPQDINMWGDWLVYATALGKADNVIKAMKEYDVNLPYFDYSSYTYIHPSYIYTAAAVSAGKQGSSTWSGSGGFGGGFGGGGGGFK